MSLTFRAADGPVHDDRGFSMVELLVVLVIVGLLATIVVVSLGEFRDDTDDSVCPADWRNLNTAVESYFAQYETNTIVPADATADGYERTLVDADVLRQVSELHDLDQDGRFVQVAGSPCVV